MNTQVIGCNREGNKYEFYFRSPRGFKSYLTCYQNTAYGAMNLYMTANIPNMSWEEYKALPDHIDMTVDLVVETQNNAAEFEADNKIN